MPSSLRKSLRPVGIFGPAAMVNMNLSEEGLAPLIVADTFLSYGWLALLMMGVAYQIRFDKDNNYEEKETLLGDTPRPWPKENTKKIVFVLSFTNPGLGAVFLAILR